MIPCYEEQEKIGSYLHSLDHLITLHQHKCEELQNIKKIYAEILYLIFDYPHKHYTFKYFAV